MGEKKHIEDWIREIDRDFGIDEDALERAIIYDKLLEKDNYQCQVCGLKDWRHPELITRDKIKSFPELDPHHITPEGIGGKFELMNLIALCRTCHEKVHIELKRQGYPYFRGVNSKEEITQICYKCIENVKKALKEAIATLPFGGDMESYID